MRVYVELCWSGGERFSFRLTTADGRRFSVSGDKWTRATASNARSLLAAETGRNRSAFRFIHH